jgi:hypothetical protein
MMPSHQPKWNEANLLPQALRQLFEETTQAHQLQRLSGTDACAAAPARYGDSDSARKPRPDSWDAKRHVKVFEQVTWAGARND